MKYLFLEYPKCSTCRNAKKWLDEHKVAYDDRHIIDQNPSAEELAEWIGRSKLPLRASLIQAVWFIKQCNLKTSFLNE